MMRTKIRAKKIVTNTTSSASSRLFETSMFVPQSHQQGAVELVSLTMVWRTWWCDHLLLGSALLARPASLASQRSQTNPGVFIVLSHCNTPHPSLLLPPPPTPNPNPPPHFSSAGDRRLLWHFLRQRLQQQGKWWRRHQLFNGNSIMFTLWRVRATPPLPLGSDGGRAC